MKTLFMAVAAIAFAMPAFAADIQVSDAFVRAAPKTAATGAAFLTLKNTGAQDDKLVAASGAVSKTVELHTHVHDNGVMRMRQVQSIAVPAGGAAQLKPGGDHIMLIDLTQPLKEGDTVALTLKFEKAGEIKVDVPVVGIAAQAAPEHKMDHGSMKH